MLCTECAQERSVFMPKPTHLWVAVLPTSFREFPILQCWCSQEEWEWKKIQSKKVELEKLYNPLINGIHQCIFLALLAMNCWSFSCHRRTRFIHILNCFLITHRRLSGLLICILVLWDSYWNTINSFGIDHWLPLCKCKSLRTSCENSWTKWNKGIDECYQPYPVSIQWVHHMPRNQMLGPLISSQLPAFFYIFSAGFATFGYIHATSTCLLFWICILPFSIQ